MSDITALSPAEIGIVKLAAAQHMRVLVPNINPATAEYIFARRIIKEAKIAGVLPKQPCDAGAGNTPNLASKSTPAKTQKNPGVKAPPPAETIAADGGTIGPKNASALKLAKAIAKALKQADGEEAGEETAPPAAPAVTPAKAQKPKGKKAPVSGTMGPATGETAAAE